MKLNGGEGGIRTHDGLAPMPVFKTGAFNRSATSPLPVGVKIYGISVNTMYASFLEIFNFFGVLAPISLKI